MENEFLESYMQKSGLMQTQPSEQGLIAFNPFDLFFGGTKKAVDAADTARSGEGPEYKPTITGSMLNRNRMLGEALRQSRGGR